MALLGAVAILVGVGSVQPDASDGNHFFSGYCTWDAAEQAHRAWGVWVPWYGDAGDWIDGARASGWQVSPRPQAESIIVLPRGTQGSGPFGHVAWVISVEPDGATVLVRSMDWTRRGVVTLHELQADGDAQFVTPPGLMVACQRGVRLRGPLRRWWVTTRQNPSAIRWQIPGATFQSREELKDFNRGSLGAFPDLVCTPHALLAEGDMVAAHWTLVDTHQGAWRSVPTTGRRIELRGMNMFRLARSKIVEGWGAWDTATMMRQLGVLASRPTAATASTAE